MKLKAKNGHRGGFLAGIHFIQRKAWCVVTIIVDCSHTYIYTYIRTHIHAHIGTHIHRHAHRYIHKHTATPPILSNASDHCGRVVLVAKKYLSLMLSFIRTLEAKKKKEWSAEF